MPEDESQLHGTLKSAKLDGAVELEVPLPLLPGEQVDERDPHQGRVLGVVDEHRGQGAALRAAVRAISTSLVSSQAGTRPHASMCRLRSHPLQLRRTPAVDDTPHTQDNDTSKGKRLHGTLPFAAW